jgi:AraC-like DNA-binding protein
VRIRDCLLDRITETVAMADLEREFGMSRYAISRGFHRAFGVALHRFVILRRLERAMDMVRGGTPLAEAAPVAGFADQSHLTRRFRAAHGMTPARWRALIA